MINNSKGNVLFLILIAVALFAALTYAITTTTRQGSSDASNEKVKLLASVVLQYATSVQQAVMRMMLVNGCTEDQINFASPDGGGAWGNMSGGGGGPINSMAPADGRCDVFGPNGGNVVWQDVPKDINLQAYGSGYWRWSGAGEVGGIGAPARADLIMFFEMNDGTSWGPSEGRTNEKFCYEINRQMGILPLESGNTLNSGNLGHFGMTFWGGSAFNDVGMPNPGHGIGDDGGGDVFFGKPTGCLWGASHGAGQLFYHVVLAR